MAEMKNATIGVKAMLESTKEPMTRVPDNYILPPSLRPLTNMVTSSHTPQVPVIDIARLNTSGHSEVVQEIGEAFEKWGFFQVINHGIPGSVLAGMMHAVQQFFDLPFEDKKLYYSNDPSRIMRFGTSFNPKYESVFEWRDYLRHPLIPTSEELLPQQPACYKEAALQYADHLNKLSSSLLAAISESLKLESKYIAKIFDKIVLLSNHYPPCPNPDLTIGVKNHTDPGGITILLQNHVFGLEINHKGKWIPIKPVPNTLSIFVGDQLEILTNGKYKSIEHRALSTAESRISIATFVNPAQDFEVRPLADLPKYKGVIFGEYLKQYTSRDLQQGKYLHSYIM